jgi:hypothetical protein
VWAPIIITGISVTPGHYIIIYSEWSHVERAPNGDSRVSQIDHHSPIDQSEHPPKGLCPDGQLSGAKGSRYVLATAEESWHRIQALCVRVQDLEFALERAHGLVAHERHPLLEEELTRIGQDPRAVVKTEPGKPPTAPPEEVPIANFGIMKISKSGSRWLGVSDIPIVFFYMTPHMFLRRPQPCPQ